MENAVALDWGARLRRERERRGWSREELARLINGPPHNIYRWEEKGHKPRADIREKLVKIFGKPEEEWGTWIGNVPYLRNLYFTGRERILARLHAALNGRNIMVVSQARAISGLGGIGKTQTAVEYAYRYADEYDMVLWVRADSREALLAQFAGLASLFHFPNQAEADQRRLAKAVLRHLETQEKRVWLLVFDNVDDISMVTEFVPRRGNGAILLTTRLHAVGKHMRKIELDKLTLEEGVRFLLERRKAARSEETEAIPETEHKAAEELYTLMDGLPLALDQAAAYIEEHACSLDTYVEFYKEQRAALLRLGNPVDRQDYPDSVATTWLLSFRRVQQASPAAADLLHVCAFLHPEGIPEELFLQSEEQARPLQDTIAILQKYSLAHHQPNPKMLTIHRLVQAVLQDRLEGPQARQWAERAVHLVSRAFPEGEMANWDRCEQFMPHVQVCADHIKAWRLFSEEAGSLLHRAGEYLYWRARYGEALALTQQAMEVRQQVLGPTHPDVAESLNNVAFFYGEMGQYTEALPRYQQALAVWEQALGPNDPLIALCLNNVAEVYRNLGQYTEALPLYERALAIEERASRHNHPQVANYLNNLALLHQTLGDYNAAQQCFQRALTIWEQALGPTHLRVATGLNNLGGLFRIQGKYAEARKCLRQALTIYEQGVGPEHPEVAHSLYNLAELAQAEGQHAEALALFQQALAMLEKALGPQHPSVATRLNNLANLYQDKGHYEEAEQLYQRALVIREQALGLNHPDTAETLHDLARLREAQGHREESIPLYERALAIRKQTLGAQHPKTRATYQRLRALLQAMGWDGEAASD